MKRSRLRFLIWLGIAAATAALLLPTVQSIAWVGGSEITISLHSESGKAVTQVSYAPFLRLDDAEQSVAYPQLEEFRFRPAQLLNPEAISVSVKAFGIESRF